MPELDKLRQMLADMNIQAVARGSGIHPNVIYRIMAGTTNPRYETVRRLVKYLTNRDGKDG